MDYNSGVMRNIGSDSKGVRQRVSDSKGTIQGVPGSRGINQTMDNHVNHELDTQLLLGSDQVGHEFSQDIYSPTLATGLEPNDLFQSSISRSGDQLSHKSFISKDSTCFYVPLNDKRQGAGVPYNISHRELELPGDKSISEI